MTLPIYLPTLRIMHVISLTMVEEGLDPTNEQDCAEYLEKARIDGERMQAEWLRIQIDAEAERAQQEYLEAVRQEEEEEEEEEEEVDDDDAVNDTSIVDEAVIAIDGQLSL
jgi:hypothetical protein